MAAPRFLFVHGAWHGAWCFDLLKLELERRAVVCETLDLPALGDDATAPAEATFEAGVERVLERIGTRRNWTLVAHSFGGFYVTEAALRASGKVRNVNYVCAYVPAAGDTFADVEAIVPTSPGFKACLKKDEASQALVLDAMKAKPLLYHDVAAGIALAACTRLKPQPLDPFARAKVEGTKEALSKIPRTAFFGEQDRILSPVPCAAMAERAGVPYEMVQTGHCPFLSAPKRVADRLLGVKS